MPTESATYISQLDAAQPVVNAPAGEGDDHLRLLKLVLQAQFPNLGPNAVTVLAVELNRLAGLSANIMDLLNAKAGLASPEFTGAPTVPTPSLSDNSKKAVNSEWVNAAMTAGVPPWLIDAVNQLQLTVASLGTAAYANTGTGAGNVMLVGAFGLGSAGSAIADLNNASVSGFYRYSNSATNSPAAEAGTLVCAVIDSNNATQWAASVESDTAWRRRKTSGTWQSWAEVGSGGGGGPVSAAPISFNGGTKTLDLLSALHFYGALSANTTIAFDNIPSSGVVRWTVEIQNASTFSITMSQSIVWDGYPGVSATATPPLRASGRTYLEFEARDHGATNKIYGWIGRTGAGT